MRCGEWEYRARRAHIQIEALDGLTQAFVFSAPGKPTVIFLPAWMMGEIREDKIARSLMDLQVRLRGQGGAQALIDEVLRELSGLDEAV